MTTRRAFALLLAGVLVAFIGALWVRTPGYMDADYYFAIGQQLATGKGFSEPFIWTYLTEPTGIPHASNLYWMPLTSLLAAAPMLLLGVSFRAAQTPFLVLTALLPLAVAQFSYTIHGDSRHAWRSGWLAVFSGYFFVYFLTTDMFILLAWIGLGVFYLLERQQRRPAAWRWVVLGVLAGLAHLARADGWLILLTLLAVVFVLRMAGWRQAALLAAGYLLIMAPWFVRNLLVAGSPLAPGVGRSLWLTSYAELFAYPPGTISFSHWLQAGIGQALQARLQAAVVNLERVLAENGLIFLVPFIVAGALQLRRKISVRAAGIYLGGLLLLMTIVFPFAGINGGVFHSSAAIMPLAWCLAPVGLERALEWGVRRRGWELARARRLFHPSSIVMAAIFTLAVTYTRAIGPEPGSPRWTWPAATYQSVGDFLGYHSAEPGPVVVNNPPGYWVATGIPAVVLPEGGITALHAVVERFQARWVILDQNVTPGLEPLFSGESVPDWLEFNTALPAADGSPVKLFRVLPDEGAP